MESISDITAVILVGGKGTRLRSVVSDRPKVLAEISGRPFLAYLLIQLLSAGIKDVIFCSGYPSNLSCKFFDRAINTSPYVVMSVF